MFRIEEYDHTVDCKTLELSDELFYEALKEGVSSRSRFHVSNSGGDDFDIVYYDNERNYLFSHSSLSRPLVKALKMNETKLRLKYK